MENRICKKCGQTKLLVEFANAGTINDVKYFRHLCIPCYSKSKHKRKESIRKAYYDYKKTLKCAKCGNDDYRVLEFDHLDKNDKSYNVGEGLKKGFGFESILQEIEKCQVLCANCHRIKTFEEGIGKRTRKVKS